MVPNATILQLYSQILVSGQMQLYCNLCNYMQLYATILQLMQLMQLYCNNFVCNYMQLCNYATCNLHNFMQLYCNYMQLGVAISTLCNFMMDRCGNFNFMQLNETICNCVKSETCCNYIATYATICNYMQLMQLY